MTEPQNASKLPLIVGGIALLVSGIGVGWAIERAGSGNFEERVHQYIVNHPEVLLEAAENYKKGTTQKQLAAAGDKLFEPFPGAVLGNPQGKTVLVEFTDFACGYCRRSVADVEALVAANPDLKVVIRELPIIAPTSGDAARWGLAAAAQGKYPAFHKAMFAKGRTDMASIEAAAREAGLDIEQARTFAAGPQAAAEVAANIEYARAMGIDGTPSWVVGDQVLVGAVGRDELAKAITADGKR